MKKKSALSFSFALLVVCVFSALAATKKKTLTDYIKEKATEFTTSPPVDNEVCFSPAGGCDVKLWKMISSAKKSLDIAVYDITHVKIAHEILVASKRIPVRMVVDTRQSKGEHSLVDLIIKGGVNVRFGSQRGIMHHKFTILDGNFLQTGSFNYTNGASEKNRENQIYLSNPKVVKAYQEQFNEIWEGARIARLNASQN